MQIDKFLRRLYEGHLWFLDLKKDEIIEKWMCACKHNSLQSE